MPTSPAAMVDGILRTGHTFKLRLYAEASHLPAFTSMQSSVSTSNLVVMSHPSKYSELQPEPGLDLCKVDRTFFSPEETTDCH